MIDDRCQTEYKKLKQIKRKQKGKSHVGFVYEWDKCKDRSKFTWSKKDDIKYEIFVAMYNI